MPPLSCPRCRRLNPADAGFCYYDGAELRSGQAGATHGLAQEFIFPSGRRCRSYDELALGCQEEWATARDLLRQGVFRQYFASIGRMDLARSTQEAMTQTDLDIALTRLVDSIAVTTTQGPKLDLQPRRLVLGSLFAGETRQVPLTITNRGRGTLQGTVSVGQGGEWLRLGSDKGNGQYAVKTAREQQILLQVDTRGLAAGQTYGARLTVVTNGGIVEVPARLDVAPHPYHKAPFQGARAPREMAEKMRANAKAAAPLLESGDLQRWFAHNGWNYPIRGTPAKGVAGVQQFFECMGLSKPPPVQLSQPEVQLVCNASERTRGQLALQTRSKKWVYASVSSNAPWLKVLTPEIAGPQQAVIAFEVIPERLPAGKSAETTLQVIANASQKLSARVRVEIKRPRLAAASGGVLASAFALAVACLLLRLLLIPAADLWARPHAVAAAAADAYAQQFAGPVPEDSPTRTLGGWLQLPWFELFLGHPTFPDTYLGPATNQPEVVRSFRDSFVSHFIRTLVLWTWWLGALIGPMFLLRRGGTWSDVPWGVIAGGVLGLIASATFACLVLVGDLVPHLLWGLALGGHGSTWMLPLWMLLALLCWAGMGAVAGLLLGLLGPIGRAVLAPVQGILAWIFRMCGLTGLAAFCAPA